MTYNTHKSEEELLIRKLYCIFRIANEQYIVTYKLLYIYRALEPTDITSGLEELKSLRKQLKLRDNLSTINRLYALVEHERLQRNGRYAPPGAKPPQKEPQYLKGWKLT